MRKRQVTHAAHAQLRAGFDFIERVGGFATVDAHACALADHAARELSSLRHGNRAPAVKVRSRERHGLLAS